MKSSFLRICLTDDGGNPSDMTFAASRTDLLPRLVPAALRKKLDRRSTNLPALASEARVQVEVAEGPDAATAGVVLADRGTGIEADRQGMD